VGRPDDHDNELDLTEHKKGEDLWHILVLAPLTVR